MLTLTLQPQILNPQPLTISLCATSQEQALEPKSASLRGLKLEAFVFDVFPMSSKMVGIPAGVYRFFVFVLGRGGGGVLGSGFRAPRIPPDG